MGSFGGFYKGEKKKKKQEKDGKAVSLNAPVFTLPELVGKKKNSK